MTRRTRRTLLCVVISAGILAGPHPANSADGNDQAAAARLPLVFDCGFKGPGYWREEIRQAVERGEIADPRARVRPELPAVPIGAGPAQCLTDEHIFLYEDTKQILLTDYSNGQLIDLMVDAANNALATHGDNFDFIGFWVNFDPHHLLGAAFYKLVSNDVEGIGNVGEPIGEGRTFDLHDELGLAGERIEGMVMMWNVNSGNWAEGDGPGADFTRLALGQEFEHRFALFLPPLLDGSVLQGDAGCGRVFHWSWKADGQGSAMEISEWVGSNPAVLEGSFVTFNTDTGGVFSYTDLYLMGYVSPQEMDAGNSELRYMDNSNCASNYFGTITTFSSADIIDAAGPRVPDSTKAQKDYKTAWIMIHQPGAPPTSLEFSKAVGILEQHMIDWDFSTLGRGTMDNSLFPDCNCNGVPDADDLEGGDSSDFNGDGVPDECQCFDLDRTGGVGTSDLLILLAQWGTDPGGPPDFNGDGTVDTADLLALLANWGSCL